MRIATDYDQNFPLRQELKETPGITIGEFALDNHLFLFLFPLYLEEQGPE